MAIRKPGLYAVSPYRLHLENVDILFSYLEHFLTRAVPAHFR